MTKTAFKSSDLLASFAQEIDSEKDWRAIIGRANLFLRKVFQSHGVYFRHFGSNRNVFGSKQSPRFVSESTDQRYRTHRIIIGDKGEFVVCGGRLIPSPYFENMFSEVIQNTCRVVSMKTFPDDFDFKTHQIFGHLSTINIALDLMNDRRVGKKKMDGLLLLASRAAKDLSQSLLSIFKK
jgi:hypothetical protein